MGAEAGTRDVMLHLQARQGSADEHGDAGESAAERQKLIDVCEITQASAWNLQYG